MKYTINELANSKGVSQPVREALLQMAGYKQLYEQVCEQYDVLAKELEATNRQVEILSDALAESRREVAAPVREDWGPGPHEYHSLPAQPALVQEPVGYEYHEYRPYGAPGEIRITAILKSRYTMPDGSTAGDYQWLIDQYRASKNTIKLIPLYTTPPAQPAPAREDWGPGPHEVHSLPAPVDWKTEYLKSVESGCSTLDELREARAELDALKQALAQPAPVQDLPFGVGGGLVAIKTLLSRDPCVHANTAIEMIDAILKEHTAAPVQPVQEPVKWSDHEPDGRRYPAVPDAFGTREGEHPQYIEGWNDCRAEMLKGMKP